MDYMSTNNRGFQDGSKYVEANQVLELEKLKILYGYVKEDTQAQDKAKATDKLASKEKNPIITEEVQNELAEDEYYFDEADSEEIIRAYEEERLKAIKETGGRAVERPKTAVEIAEGQIERDKKLLEYLKMLGSKSKALGKTTYAWAKVSFDNFIADAKEWEEEKVVAKAKKGFIKDEYYIKRKALTEMYDDVTAQIVKDIENCEASEHEAIEEKRIIIGKREIELGECKQKISNLENDINAEEDIEAIIKKGNERTMELVRRAQITKDYDKKIAEVDRKIEEIKKKVEEYNKDIEDCMYWREKEKSKMVDDRDDQKSELKQSFFKKTASSIVNFFSKTKRIAGNVGNFAVGTIAQMENMMEKMKEKHPKLEEMSIKHRENSDRRKQRVQDSIERNMESLQNWLNGKVEKQQEIMNSRSDRTQNEIELA